LFESLVSGLLSLEFLPKILYDLPLLLYLKCLHLGLILEPDYLGLILEHNIVPVDQLPRARVKLVVQDRLLSEQLPVLSDAGLVLRFLGRRWSAAHLLDLGAHFVDGGGELHDEFVFFSDLRKEALDLLEGRPAHQLLQSLPHLPHALIKVQLPGLAHLGQFILEGLGSQLRGLDVPHQLLYSIFVLVVLMHLPQGLLVLYLVLYGLGLDLELSDLLVDSAKLQNDSLVGLFAFIEHAFDLAHLLVPFIPSQSFLPADPFGLLLELPEALLVFLLLDPETPIFIDDLPQLSLSLAELFKHADPGSLYSLEELLRFQLALMACLFEVLRLLLGKGRLALDSLQVLVVEHQGQLQVLRDKLVRTLFFLDALLLQLGFTLCQGLQGVRLQGRQG
jgi:hypothetical protein